MRRLLFLNPSSYSVFWYVPVCVIFFVIIVVFSYTVYYTVAVSAESEKNKSGNGAPTTESRAKGTLSLSDILYRSEAYIDSSPDDPRSEREDSDYDEELELDYETSISGDEGHDSEADMVHRSINLGIPGKDESANSADHSNGSFGSPTSQNDGRTYQVEPVS